MKITVLVDYVNQGREIEFKFEEKMYSITYLEKKGVEYISFCEFYKEANDVKSIDDLLLLQRKGVTVRQMWEALEENDVWVY